jgi:carboxymethylenebutenolidase
LPKTPTHRPLISASILAGWRFAFLGTCLVESTFQQTRGKFIKVADGEMPGYFTRPNGVSNPPVVLVAMEIFGLHEYIKDVTRRLAKLGAFAVAPDYYFRKGTDLTRITDIPRLLPIASSKPDAELFSDLNSTVAWAKSQGGDTSRLGIVGFCRGGRNVWEYAAHNSALKAAVAFYGPPVDPPNPLWPKSPTQLAPEPKDRCWACTARPIPAFPWLRSRR